MKPMKRAKRRIGATGTTEVAKKAAAVVMEVRSIVKAASGPTSAAMFTSLAPSPRRRAAWAHLSVTTNRSSTPMPMMTKSPRKLRKGKKLKPNTSL